MTRQELHKELGKLLYIEDFGMIDVIISAIIANSLKLGDPVWLTLIAPSSGGKSQIIRPFGIANPTLVHRLDDLTSNTFISGSLGVENSLLGRIGNHGIISMDDLTVLFSKNHEQRGEILSQFRMIYDGRFAKSSGNRKEEMQWNGYVGMISGSTPSIYRFFAEVADMGERFINYRMRPFDSEKATQFIMNNNHSAKDLDDAIANVLKQFLQPLLGSNNKIYEKLSDEVKQRIVEISRHCTLLRTSVHLDERSGLVDEFPEPEMPFRVMKQLTYLAQAMQIMNRGELDADMLRTLDWVAYSLANDKRRAYLKALVTLDMTSKKLSSRNISSLTGLHTEIVKKGLDQLQALGIIALNDEIGGEKFWTLQNRDLAKLCREIDTPKTDDVLIIMDT